MTHQVPVNQQPTNVVDGGQPNIPPANMQPGFVQPMQAPTLPAIQQPAAAPAPETDATLAAIQELTKALAAQQPAPAAAPAAEDSLNQFDVNTIEDPILKSMATVMKTVGKDLDLDRVLGKAIDTGNAEFIDVAYLREKAGANADELITIAQGIVQGVVAEAQKVQQSVYDTAGGVDQWNACAGAFNTKAPEALKTTVVTMLNSGDAKLVKAASELVVQFAKSQGFVPNANPLVQTGGASMPAAQALSKEEFQTELFKLDKNARDFPAKRGALFARRELGKRLGK